VARQRDRTPEGDEGDAGDERRPAVDLDGRGFSRTRLAVSDARPSPP